MTYAPPPTRTVAAKDLKPGDHVLATEILAERHLGTVTAVTIRPQPGSLHDSVYVTFAGVGVNTRAFSGVNVQRFDMGTPVLCAGPA